MSDLPPPPAPRGAVLPPQTPKPDPWPPKWLPIAVVSLILLVGLGLYVGVGGDDGSDGGSSDASQQKENSQEVCGEFRAVAEDADLLTAVELRGRIQEIYQGNDIVLASIPIQNAVREMLATVTGSDIDGFEAAVDEMDHQCDLVGA